MVTAIARDYTKAETERNKRLPAGFGSVASTMNVLQHSGNGSRGNADYSHWIERIRPTLARYSNFKTPVSVFKLENPAFGAGF
jgi:hypothetical protein